MCLFSISGFFFPSLFLFPQVSCFSSSFLSAPSLLHRLAQDVKGCLEIPLPTPATESLYSSGLFYLPAACQKESPFSTAPGVGGGVVSLYALVSPSVKEGLMSCVANSALTW